MDAEAVTTVEDVRPSVDTGLNCLVAVARFHGVPAEVAQLSHAFGNPGEHFDEMTLLRAAKTLGFKASAQTVQPERLQNPSLPCMARDIEGRYFIIAKLAHTSDGQLDKLLIHRIEQGPPITVTVDQLREIWNGDIILLTRRGNPLKNLQQHFDISWFIPALVKYRKFFGEVILVSFFLQLFALATPLFFQVVMDKVLVHKGFTTLDVLAFGFLVVAVFEAILGGLRNYLFSHTTNRVDVELGARLFNHLMALPLAYFEARQVGQSVARVRELDTIRNFITGTALTLIIDLTFTLVFFAVMWYYSPTLCLIVLGTIPFYVLLSIFITPILQHRLNKKFQYGAENQSFLVESVTGVQTVKALAVEPQMQRKWEDQLAHYVTASFKAQNLNNVANQVAGLINKIMTLLLIWWGAHLVIDGDITVGQLVAFNMLAGRVSGPILKLVQLWQDFQQAGISVKRLGDILNAPREPGFNPNRSTLPQLKGQVKFENVRFRYRADGPVVLNNLQLDVRPGEVIGIVGRSGSGKSTLTKLIQRLYVPESGGYWWMAWIWPWWIPHGCAAVSAWCCRKTSCSIAACGKTSR
jgi:ATP-binding cassette, subfamily B, bacterial HlyB/CyaB